MKKIFLGLILVFVAFSAVEVSAKSPVEPMAPSVCPVHGISHQAFGGQKARLDNQSVYTFEWGYWECACGFGVFTSGRPTYPGPVYDYFYESQTTYQFTMGGLMFYAVDSGQSAGFTTSSSLPGVTFRD